MATKQPAAKKAKARPAEQQAEQTSELQGGAALLTTGADASPVAVVDANPVTGDGFEAPADPYPGETLADDRVEQIAMAFHHAKAALVGEAATPWDQAKDGAIQGVQYVLANPQATPRDVHDAWAQRKIQDGWGYGPVKDAANRTHPELVNYENLTPAQQLKSALLQGVTNGLTAWLSGRLARL